MPTFFLQLNFTSDININNKNKNEVDKCYKN